MRCPFCEESHEESLVFPANNIEMSPQVIGYLDRDGVPVYPKAVALKYGCTQGHSFSLHDVTKVIKLEESIQV